MKSKILFVHHSGNLGGAPKSLGYLLKNLDRDAYIPYLINISEGPANEIFRDSHVSPIIVKGAKPFHGSTVAQKSFKLLIKNYLFFIPTLVVAYFQIRKIKPDIIHLNSTCLFAFALAAKLWHKETPVICHVREPLREGFWGWPLRFFSKKAVDGFIAISHYDLNSLRLTDHFKGKSKVVYNFVDNSSSPDKIAVASLKESFGIGEKDIVFLFLARFAAGNGVNELISMAQAVLKEKPDYLFLLAGKDDTFPTIDLDTDRIKLLPFYPRPQELLALADVFVCPFTEPHFSRGLIEASAAGIPTLGNNVGGVNELIRDGQTGFLYNDKKSFNRFVQLLGENPDLRKKMGTEGVQFADRNFNYHQNIKATFEFLKSFLNDSKGHS